jgi:hypothetical protein
MGAEPFHSMVCDEGHIVDVKGLLNGTDAGVDGRRIWRL